MKLLISVLLTALLVYIFGLFLPWWSIALAGFLVPLLVRPSLLTGFLGGFLGCFLAWAGVALWIDVANESILSRQMAGIFSLGSGVLMIFLTALIGALVGGFAALTGASIYPSSKRKRLA
jgi:hypothetical protein